MNTILVHIENWLQGILISLILYHIFTYLFTRDKGSITYSLYLFVLFVFLIPNITNEPSIYITLQFFPLYKQGYWFLLQMFILCYIFFTHYFLDIDEVIEGGTINLKKIVKLGILVTSGIFIIDAIVFNYKYFSRYNFFIFLPFCVCLFGIILFKNFKVNNLLNWLYLLGITFLLLFGVISIVFRSLPSHPIFQAYNINTGHIFMIGVFLETIIMSVALGYKKLVYKKEKERADDRLIKKLQENQKLKNTLNKRLKSAVLQKTEEISKTVSEANQYKISEVENQYNNELNKLKLTSLLNQMNPHFIFNALNSIKLFIINNDVKNAAYYLNKFSKLIRKILTSSYSQETTLKEELDTLDLYMNLENIRFSNEIKYHVTVANDIILENKVIPPMVLQPFIENAIWHGVSSIQGEKKIELHIKKTSKKFLEISIRDNGIGRKQAKLNKEKRRIKRKSVGLSITKERLKNFVKDSKHEFNLAYIDLFDEQQNPAGTKVILTIPLE